MKKGVKLAVFSLSVAALCNGFLYPLNDSLTDALSAAGQNIIVGDINNNGIRDGEDLELLSGYLLGQDIAADKSAFDVTADGAVDVYDLIALRQIVTAPEQEAISLKINEVCSANKTSLKDSAGTYPDWIEIYNPSGKDISLEGIGISDGKTNKFKFTFPAGAYIPADGYVLVLCDNTLSQNENEFHAPFKISSLGETIYMTHPTLGEIDSVEIPALETDVTYGRYLNGSENFMQLSPTPNTSNDSAAEVIETPAFSAPGGFYDSEFSLSLTGSSENEIYYTTDGSDPRNSFTAIKYSEEIRIYDNTNEPNKYSSLKDITLSDYQGPNKNVDKGIVIRAVTKAPDGNFSSVTCNSYFVGKSASYYKNMKVISLVTDGDYLFDSDNGAYMVGKGYRDWLNTPGHPNYDNDNVENLTNYNKDGKESEFPVTIQVFDNGEAVYTSDVGARIAGNWTRAYPQKSLRFYARSEYGDSKMKYAFIDGMTDLNGDPIDKFDKITLRNGGNDNYYLHFRDAFIHDVASDRACDVQGSEPCILFIDGEYWGFYFIREKLDDYYIQSHYNIPKENITMIKNGGLVSGQQASADEYFSFAAWASSADMTVDENYKRFCDSVDVQSFMDYIAIETYLNNDDWAKKNSSGGYINNWQLWRSDVIDDTLPYSDGKWRFMLYDLDMSASLYLNKTTMPDYDYLNNMYREPNSFVTMFYNLMNNEEFRKNFYDNYNEIINVTFNFYDISNKIDEYVSNYREAILDTRERFRDDWAIQYLDYDNEIYIFKDYFRQRPDHAERFLEELMRKYS